MPAAYEEARIIEVSIAEVRRDAMGVYDPDTREILWGSAGERQGVLFLRVDGPSKADNVLVFGSCEADSAVERLNGATRVRARYEHGRITEIQVPNGGGPAYILKPGKLLEELISAAAPVPCP